MAALELRRRERAAEAYRARESLRQRLYEMLPAARDAARACEGCNAVVPNRSHTCLRERSEYIATLSDIDRAWAHRWWMATARGKQIPPPDPWVVWILRSGRAFGKTWVGASQCIEHASRNPHARIAMVSRTSRSTDTDTLITGESGVLTISPPDFVPAYNPSRNLLTWPNGAKAFLFSAEVPDQARGQNLTFAWCDELASWEYPDAWNQLRLALRSAKGEGKIIATTTPRPTEFMRKILAEPGVVVTTGSTFENSDNLSAVYIGQVVRQYEGTRLGQQEIFGAMLEDVPGALWAQALIDAARRLTAPDGLLRVVVAVDPAVSSHEGSAETGIVVAGVDAEQEFYVLADLSGVYTPDAWARAAIAAYEAFGADRIVAEVNNGGDLVERNLRTVDENVSYSAVRASRGKAIRAEPISALYEQGRVHHCGQIYEQLERQMCTWSPLSGAKSPDRLDALVWAIADLLDDGAGVDDADQEARPQGVSLESLSVGS